MNILPMAIAFLIIFSCVAFTFLREIKSFSLMETTFHGYNRTEMSVNNKIAQRTYRKIQGESLNPSQRQTGNASKGEYVSRRSLFPPLENSKFNLSPLIKLETDLKLSPLYEPLAELLRTLYKTNLFSKEKNADKLEYRLIEEMVKKARKVGEVEDVSELHPEDPALRKVFYKMLQGTNQYDRKTGIPPLRDFLTLGKGDKTVALSFASPLLLEALFGPEISQEILDVEREKAGNSNNYYYFSKEDLESLLLKTPNKTPLFAAFDPYLDYSKQFESRTEMGGRDKITGIGVEKRL